MPSKTGAVGGAGLSAGDTGLSTIAPAGAKVEGGTGVGLGRGVVNRSRNRSSRNFGVRRVRSTRASCPCSVRWRVSKKMVRPSGDQAIVFANTLARKLTGRGV